MSTRRFPWWQRALAALLMVGCTVPAVQQSLAGFRQSAVGGVMVNDAGLVEAARPGDFAHLKQLRADQLKQMSADINQATPLRKVSLKRLQAQIAENRSRGLPNVVTDEMAYLAGLTQIQYLFVYPDENDIVLAGPGEGLVVNDAGEMVGAQSGRPALKLDDLLVALRHAAAARQAPITCSIDPTAEGLAALNAYLKTPRQFTPQTASEMERAMGMQKVTVTGVPQNSGFARTMVAADYRMKRIGMGLDGSGIRGLPSYMDMISSGAQSAAPRWWLAPDYDALLKDEDGLAWELRGRGVKCLTEDSLVSADGAVKNLKGRTSSKAQLWADRMTEHYDDLAVRSPIFGELKGLMDMAVFASLIVKEDLAGRAGCDLSLLLDATAIPTEDYHVPQRIESVATVVRSGKRTVVSVSGGVEINPWDVLDEQIANAADYKPANKAAKVDVKGARDQSVHAGMNWWWN